MRNHKVKRALSLILTVAVILTTAVSILPMSVSAAQQYVPLTEAQRQAIADYAVDMTENPSVKRSWFDASGGDCTSFTSNALLAAGITWDTESSQPWYYYDPSVRTGTWATSNTQESYIGNHQSGSTGLLTSRLYKGSPNGLNVNLIPGDLIFFDYDGDGNFSHSAIVTTGGSSSGAIRFASHSAGSVRSFSTWTPTNTIAVYRIVGYFPNTVPAGLTDIRPATYQKGSNYLQTSRTVSTNIYGQSNATRHYLITVQGYEDYSSGGKAFGYCTSLDNNFNGDNRFNNGSAPSDKLVKALSFGLSDKKQSYTAVNAKLGTALQSNTEAFYVTQMGVWYALGQLSYSGGVIRMGSYTVQENADNGAAARVLAATKKLFDIMDNGSIATPPSVAPNLTITPPSPNNATYNASADAFIAGPYSVSVSGGSEYDVSFAVNGVGATVVNGGFQPKSHFNIGEQFYIKVPNTAGIATLRIKAEADVTIAPTVKLYTPQIHGDMVQGVVTAEARTPDDVADDEFDLKVETFGKLSIHKVTNKNEPLGGVTFGVFTDPDCTTLAKDPVTGRDVTVVTDTAGSATTPDLLPFTFYVKEINMTDSQFEVLNINPTVYQVTVQGGRTTPINANAGNVVNDYKTITIQIQKENANPGMMTYSMAGGVFEIRNLTTGEKWRVTTTVAGLASQDKIPLGIVEIEEITAPANFERNPQILTYDLRKGTKGVDVIFQRCIVPEYPQTGKITITKFDAETYNVAQGDASLKGAIFTLHAAADIRFLNGEVKYAKDQIIQTLDCGIGSTSVTTIELPLANYYVREVKPPIGMNPTGVTVPVSIYYHDQNARTNMYSADVYNTVIKGRIGIVKHDDTPDPDVTPENPNIEKPMESVKFKVWLISAGSFEKAKPTERDIIETDGDGFGLSKLLPYGLYRCEEQVDEATEGHNVVKPFNVFINSEGRTYWYILWDDTPQAFVRIIKTDAETGKSIPAEGVTFKIKDLDSGEYVSMKIMYPTPIEIMEFMTDSSGRLVTPEPLPFNKKGYEIVELQSPYGYLLNEKPLKFFIKENTEDIVELFFSNTPAKGTVSITKTGNLLVGANPVNTEYGTVYTPVYEPRPLKGVVYQIIADEDIITPDGTLRLAKGAVAETVTTGADGIAKSKPLYLGKYYAIELSVGGNEMVLDGKKYPFELKYKDQYTALVNENLYVENIRQKVQIDLLKVMEKPVGALADFDPFLGVVFGLFAKNDIKDADGKVAIPKDGLAALMPIDSAGRGGVNGEYPFTDYYVKELSTNPAYQLDPTEYPVKAEYKGQSVTVSTVQVNNGGKVTNSLKPGTITVSKTGNMLVVVKETDTPFGKLLEPVYAETGLAGAVFDVIAGENHYDVNGVLLHKQGDIVETLTTGADGTATTQPLHLGKWILLERQAPEFFVLDETPHEVTLGIDNLHEDVISTQIGIANVRQKIGIELTKTMEIPDNAPADFNPYENVVFGLFSTADIAGADGEIVIPADSLIATFGVSEGSGYYEAELPFTPLYLKELQTADGYTLSETVYDIIPEYAGQTETVSTVTVNGGEDIVNELQSGSLKIIKVFEGRETPLENVPFHIVGKTTVGTTVEIYAKTDSRGEILLEDLLVGEYTVLELASDLTVAYVLSPEQTAAVAADQITELQIDNRLIRGNVHLLKTDKANGDKLAGAVFELFDPAGEKIDSYTTNAEGEITVTGLVYGTGYKFVETKAPATFKITQTEYVFDITADGATVELTAENEKIPYNPDIPKTGDDSNPMLYVVLMGVSAGALVLTLRRRKRTA